MTQDTPAPNDMPDLLPVKLETDDMGLYIYAIMPDGSRNMVFDIRVRGWGNLTGGGARNLDPKLAEKIQKMWAEEMCARYNNADLTAPVAAGGEEFHLDLAALAEKKSKAKHAPNRIRHIHRGQFYTAAEKFVEKYRALQKPPPCRGFGCARW